MFILNAPTAQKSSVTLRLYKQGQGGKAYKTLKMKKLGDERWEAVEAMKEAHYVDDRRFAESYLQAHAGSRSRLRLRMDLLNKGISSDLADEILAEWEEENGSRIFAEEVGQIRELLRKRHYDPAAANWQETQKTKAFLMRKGYSSEVIRAALRD